MGADRTLLVIPHYCDSHRLRPFLEELVRTLPASFSILVSDDGSPDDEVGKLREVIARTSVPNEGPEVLAPLLNQTNHGKGGAVYAGWNSALDHGYSRLGFVDADGAVNAREILRGERYWNEHAGEFDVLVGSRIESPDTTVNRRWIRHVCGRVFANSVIALTGLPIHDTQCGYKVLTASAYRAIQADVRAEGFAFDVELLLLLQRTGFRLREFPVNWSDIADGKVRLLREALPMIGEVLRVKARLGSRGR